jgi:hypothetical protein
MSVNLLTFFKPDHFINTGNIRCIAMKRSSLQKEQVNLQLKSFYEIDPRGLYHKTYYRHYLRFL